VSAITQIDPDDRARISAIDFTHRLVRNWQEALGIDLLGAYLIGSLAHAGFSRRYSDVDIALITASGLSPQALDRLRSGAVALSADWGPKVSIFWADRQFSLGRFPPLDRVDYLDHAVVLMERERVRPPVVVTWAATSRSPQPQIAHLDALIAAPQLRCWPVARLY